MISDKAVISPKAKIATGVEIYPFVYIEDDVEIGEGCVLYPGVNVLNGTRLGKNNTVFQNTVLSAIPQDFNYTGDATELVIGDGNIIRENVVINRATYKGDKTVIGNNNFIMEGVHISHDAIIGNGCVLGYGTKIAGCVEIADAAIFSSGCIVNPGARIGTRTMIQGGCRISHDVPPYIIATDAPARFGGTNAEHLSHFHIPEKVQAHIANAYRLLFQGQNSTFDSILSIKQQVPDSPEIQEIVKFLEDTKLGIIGKEV
ncbi:MAG: acyl-ACP--UDP-N-acetylglucosamine O-acyltransferase [Bacteroidaceae bacterium]|nr:acyl-ACP--UDP-N-acetylglucosamine O-acyltransferase [Bacteroidaceae bacterium]